LAFASHRTDLEASPICEGRVGDRPGLSLEMGVFTNWRCCRSKNDGNLTVCATRVAYLICRVSSTGFLNTLSSLHQVQPFTGDSPATMALLTTPNCARARIAYTDRGIGQPFRRSLIGWLCAAGGLIQLPALGDHVGSQSVGTLPL